MQLPSALTLAGAHAAAQALTARLEALPRGAAASLDASALTAFDSSALAVLLQASRAARSRGVILHLTGAPPKLLELAALYGVEALLPPSPKA